MFSVFTLVVLLLSSIVGHHDLHFLATTCTLPIKADNRTNTVEGLEAVLLRSHDVRFTFRNSLTFLHACVMMGRHQDMLT
jgi:hypothetical protein